MKSAALGLLFWMTFPWGALAATGDLLYIQHDGVNVRQGPSPEAPVSGQVDLGARLYELGRQGEWVQIGQGEPALELGWVHASLVGPIWPKAELSAGKTASAEAELLALARRLSAQVEQLSRDVLALQQQIRALTSDVGHLDAKVTRLR